jgi:hypothetical protein
MYKSKSQNLCQICARKFGLKNAQVSPFRLSKASIVPKLNEMNSSTELCVKKPSLITISARKAGSVDPEKNSLAYQALKSKGVK